MQEINNSIGMGWLPDYPDFQDYTDQKDIISPKLVRLGQTDTVKAMINKIGISNFPEAFDFTRPVDLRRWCSPIENQGSLGSCTAHAGIGIVEYFEKRAFGKYIDASRRFLYKVTRNLMRVTGDTGAYLRTTMGAMVLFGVPPEEYWDYSIPNFDIEPSPFCYSFAQNFQTIQYVRLDPLNISREALLIKIKKYLVAGLPSMFGFSVYPSIEQANTTGKIPFPCRGEGGPIGGHAIDAIGFNDKLEIKNSNCDNPTKGAFLIRNSWGSSWGDGGYGWLPYEYVLNGLAVDWWTLLKNEWVDTNKFKVN